jgi:hypothetical protein
MAANRALVSSEWTFEIRSSSSSTVIYLASIEDTETA